MNKLTTKQEVLNPKTVYEVFKLCAPRYDAMARHAWMGLEKVWWAKLIERLDPVHNTNLIDVAGGTGAITSRFLDVAAKRRLKNYHVTFYDINQHMMDKAKLKLAHFDPSLMTWTLGDFHDMPYEDGTFNAYSVAFGYRYSDCIETALKEAHRVLQPGGKFVCLDFGRVNSGFVKWCVQFHAKVYLPLLGYLANEAELNDLLLGTLQHFPPQETISEMIKAAGFADVGYDDIHGGLTAVHYGVKK